MYKIEYHVGDVRTFPVEGSKIIPHCCNDIKAMGAGVARALYTKWPIVREHYINNSQKLGEAFLIPVDTNTYVCNMIGQHKVMVRRNNGVSVGEDGRPPVRYLALSLAMNRLRILIRDENLPNPTIVAPKFAADLAGGNWDFIETLIHELWLPYFPVHVCTLE